MYMNTKQEIKCNCPRKSMSCPLVELVEMVLRLEEESKNQPKKEPWDGIPRVVDRTGRVVML